MSIPCFLCLFVDELKARVCKPHACLLLDDWLLRETTASKRGSPRRHPPEVKDLAVSLYTSGSFVTLKDVADQLNSKYLFDPPLSSDSVGRWVQAKNRRVKKTSEVLWVKRRQKYGQSGMRRKKRQALSDLRRSQWSNDAYKKDMSLRMSDYPLEQKKRIVALYQKGKKPSQIRRLFKSEGIQAPALVTIHQILNANHIPKHSKSNVQR